MSEVRSFFRTCPACGRRFQIRLLNKKLEDTERHTEKLEQYAETTGWAPGLFRPGMYLRVWPTAVAEDGRPVTISVDELQYTYKCNRCGHEWSEKHIEEH